LSKYEFRYWSSIKKQLIEKRNLNHFQNPSSIIEEDMEKTLRYLNEIWSNFIDEMNKIKSSPKYVNLLRNYDRKKYEENELAI
jgi:hypothetical protein